MNYHDAYLEEVLRRLSGPNGRTIIAAAVALTHRWDAVPGANPYFGRRWREIFREPPAKIRNIVMADSEEGQRLRHTMPFPGALTNAEKAALRQKHGRPLAHASRP